MTIKRPVSGLPKKQQHDVGAEGSDSPSGAITSNKTHTPSSHTVP